MDNSKVGYIVMPMDLTEKQNLIYTQMYKKCNFKDMAVKYTFEQLANDIKIIKLDKHSVRREINKMVEKGYLTILKKGTKGNATVFKINKIADLNCNEYATNTNSTATNVQQKCNLKASNNATSSDIDELKSNEYATNMQQKCNKCATPTKEKEKENNIYSENMANAIKRYPGKKIKSVRDRKLPRLIKQYGEEQIIKCIDRYCNECKGKDKQYILNESTFWNGRYEDYLDENYLDKQEPTKIVRREEMKMTFRDL